MTSVKTATKRQNTPNAIDQIKQLLVDPKTFTSFQSHGVTDTEVKMWLSHFGSGLSYTLKNYGATASGFGIFNIIGNTALKQETDNQLIYDADNDFIAVTRNFIASGIKAGRGTGPCMGNANTQPRNDFTSLEIAFLLGVEEGFHAYQYKHKKNHYPMSAWCSGTDQSNIGSAFHYATNPIERDARQAVLQAARDMNFGWDSRYVRQSDGHLYTRKQNKTLSLRS